MALPKINDVPKYDLIIPSTKAEIKFKPFLTKEQKILLMAMETQDNRQILNAIIDTIQSCVLSPIDVKTLSSFDIEYIFTQIRAKSVGEKSRILLACSGCDEQNEIEVDLEKVVVDVPKATLVVKLNDTYSLKLRYPKYQSILQNDSIQQSGSVTEVVYQTIIECLDSLQSDSENIKFDDETEENIAEFLGSLTNKQFSMLAEFVQNLPRMSHTVEFDCKHCKHHNSIKLQGIRDFF